MTLQMNLQDKIKQTFRQITVFDNIVSLWITNQKYEYTVWLTLYTVWINANDNKKMYIFGMKGILIGQTIYLEKLSPC